MARRARSRRERLPVWWEMGFWSETLNDPVGTGTANGTQATLEVLDATQIDIAEGEALVVERVVGQWMMTANTAAGAASAQSIPVKWRLTKAYELSGNLSTSHPWITSEAEDEFLSEGLLFATPAAASAAGAIAGWRAAAGFDAVAAGSPVFAWPAGHLDIRVKRRLVHPEVLALTFATATDFVNPTDIIRVFGWVRCLCRRAAS